MQIIYGYGEQKENYKDITLQCLQGFMHNGILYIPANDDYRATQFGDPVFGKPKNIVIEDNGVTKTFTAEQEVYHIPLNIAVHLSLLSPNEKLAILHNKIILAGGFLEDELPEQTMAVSFIDPGDRVLELGSNIGRNTLIISHLLEKSGNLVTLETTKTSIYYLKTNRAINHQQFHIEHAALSLRRLIQKGWQTYTIDDISPIPSDCFAVNIISYADLVKKYGIQFRPLNIENGHPSVPIFKILRAAANETLKTGTFSARF
jgi:hypothetical protein